MVQFLAQNFDLRRPMSRTKSFNRDQHCNSLFAIFVKRVWEVLVVACCWLDIVGKGCGDFLPYPSPLKSS